MIPFSLQLSRQGGGRDTVKTYLASVDNVEAGCRVHRVYETNISTFIYSEISHNKKVFKNEKNSYGEKER